MIEFRPKTGVAALSRRMRRGKEILVSFAGRLPPEIEEALRQRRADRARVELFAQRPYDLDALASLRASDFVVHPQEPVSAEAVIIDRHYPYSLETGEPLASDSGLLCQLLALRSRELVVITGRIRRCDDPAGLLILEELEHYHFDVRSRLPVVRGQWVRVLGSRLLSPFAPTYLAHTVQVLEVRPLVRDAEGGAPGHALLAEELPPGVLARWEAMLRDRGFLDLWDAAAYLQQHGIHPEPALRSAAPGASRLVVWALTAAAALALQHDVTALLAVKSELQRGLCSFMEIAAGVAGAPGRLRQPVGLTPPALEAVIDAVALEVVAAVLRQEEPRPTGYSARTGA